jgi:hypothetical protein
MYLMDISIRQLPDKFRKNGFSFQKIRRVELICLYEAIYGSGLIYYFVFRVQVKPSKVFKDKQILPYERMPNGESFGMSAWVIKTLDAAMNKFDSLVEKKHKVDQFGVNHK